MVRHIFQEEEGRLRLTAPVSQFIPQFKDLKVAVTLSQTAPANRPITIRGLLTHTSAIVAPPQIPGAPDEPLAHFLPAFAATPLEFQPGTRWAYSNTVGFDVLAGIPKSRRAKPSIGSCTRGYLNRLECLIRVFGWSGAFGTHFWVDPKEQLVAILMIQTPAVAIRPDFETAVMQAVAK